MTRPGARRIVESAGGAVTTSVSRRTDLLVVGMGGWPLLPNGEVSSALRRAETLNARGARIRIISEEDFLEETGVKSRGPALAKRYTAEELCTLTGVDLAKLRRWEQLGLIRASGGRFDFQDLISLRTLTELVDRGVRPEVIHSSLKGLATILPGTDRPLAQLQIVLGQAHSLMADLDGCRITAEGQFVLDFDAPKAHDAGSLEFAAEAPGDAESWIERGSRFEENEEFDHAAEAYRQAIALNPAGDAFFNLGNVLRSQDRHDAAIEMFRLAAAMNPAMAEAWYNVADIEEEQGQLMSAVESLQRAVAICPTFADAYYNLALCFEKLGGRSDARRYWSQYLRLDSSSDWAIVAQAHLTAL